MIQVHFLNINSIKRYQVKKLCDTKESISMNKQLLLLSIMRFYNFCQYYCYIYQK